MDAEVDEAPRNQSPPPLQQPSDLSPPQPQNLPINGDIHDSLSNFPNDGGLNAEITEETNDDAMETAVVFDHVVTMDVGELHVVDGEIVAEEKGNDGTDVDLEPVNVEGDELNLKIVEEEVQVREDNTCDAPLMVEQEHQGDAEQQEQVQGEGDGEGEGEREGEGEGEGEEEVEGEQQLHHQVDDEKQEQEQEQEEDEEEGEQQHQEDDEEQEQEQEQDEDEEEEEEADGDGGFAEDKEVAEEMEVVEEASVGKRKRGHGKNSKSSGRVPSRKKMEEDVCFICFDGGDLVLCDRRGCPKAYHPSCVNHDEAFFQTKGKWNCGWHICSNCEKNAFYMCYTCTFSLCKGCIKDAVMLCVRGNKGFCETCMRTVMLIEQNEQGNNMVQVDFDDKNSWEYLFKDYYVDLKGKLSLTFDELSQAKNPWKGSDMLPSKEESPDELFDATNDRGSDSDSSYVNADSSRPKKRKSKKRAKSRSKEGNSYSAVTAHRADGTSTEESTEWASKELLEFVMHMRNGDKSMLSQFDVQALLLEYIKINKLRDPRRKSQIICDVRLQNLFGKPRVGHFEMLKLLESHFLIKEDSQAEDLQGSVVDTEISHLDGDGNGDAFMKAGKDKKRKSRRKGDTQSKVDDYAAIDNHNINLIYLRRNLVEDLLEDTEKFHDSVVGCFVRIRISGSGQKQDLYRLVQVVGTCKTAESYKVGKRMTDILLEILNLNKTEIVSMDIISNQEFTEDECKRLRQSIKCGLINRMTVGDIQDKAIALQAVRVKDWLETEIVRLSHLRDRASEKGRRKELRECVEKLQLLKTPEERQRRLEEIPEIHVDPKMDPSYESDEGDEMEDKRQENFMRPRGSTVFGRRGRETVSPRSGSISSDSWSGTKNYSHVNQELNRNLSNKGFSVKGDDVSNDSEILNGAQLHQGRDRESHLSNSWERQKLMSSSMESGAKNIQPLVTSESFSTAVLEAAAVPAVKANETEKMWHYQDPSGKIQGPFSIVQLRKWNNTGYFPADLRVWRTTERQDESILLTDVFAGKFSNEPSIVDKTPPKAQIVHDVHHSSSFSGKSPLVAQGLASKISPLVVEVPKNPGNGWGSDAVVRNESTNLPSPTPQTASGGLKGIAFENNWSPTPVQLTGPVLGNSQLQATELAQVVSNMQNQTASGHNSRAEAQVWGGPSVVPNNSATMPAQPASHGLWGDASSVQQNSASFTTGNPTGSLSTHGFHGMMTAPESWRPQVPSSQANIMAPPPPNIPWGMNMPGNQNISWNGSLPANMNVNWMPPAQVPAPGNANPGWAAPTQGIPPVNSVSWAAPGQGLPNVNANAGWAVPSQGVAPGNANPAWATSAGNPGMRGNEQSHNGDRFNNQGDRGSRGGGKSWNRQSSFGSGGGGRGGSSRSSGGGGQRGVCKFYESGNCRWGASCDYQHK
ncbi:zinc finger CCCH domain-containing protein 19 [Cicer arietinum]|uniref:Zinc finger CCCH domain-containing protein 19 n=1 Tax=Cicer arietinum TaxID=3827 RepID=A0A1S3E7P9_CICAR|nr:zinc finger CCCH domain-containing protein 19 [Cicer arietinum]